MTYQQLAPTAPTSQKWAVTLSCWEGEKLEERVAKIVTYLANNSHLTYQWVISDLDATGNYGDRLTKLGNSQETFLLSSEELLNLLHSEGQVIELEANLLEEGQELYKIIIRDGFSIDVLGSGELLPEKVLGNYIPTDRKLFLW